MSSAQTVSSTQQSLAAETGNELGHVRRPARALIGWMSQEEAQLNLAGRQTQDATKPEYAAKAKAAREAVQRRVAGVDQTGILVDPSEDLQDYLRHLQSIDAFKPFASEGWVVKIADLTKICALQPVVFSFQFAPGTAEILSARATAW